MKSLTSIVESDHPDEIPGRVEAMAKYVDDYTTIQTIAFTAHGTRFMTERVNEHLRILQDSGVEIIDIRYPDSENIGAVIIFAAPTGWLDDNAALIEEMARKAGY